MTFAKERDRAFMKAVMEDKWDDVKKYSRKYRVPIPADERVMKAAIYKAVQYCTKIPNDVKGIAMQKCLELGFSPFISDIEESEE